MINGAQVNREDGPLMLFKLIDMVAVETKATVHSIMKTLTGAGLASIMTEVKSDIKEFNNRVNMLMVALRARRREVPDITPHLFEAYQACDDHKFVDYIADHEAQFEDGRITTVSNTTLMHTALQKYKTLVDKGVWQQKSKQELEFIAMMTQWEDAKKKLVPKKKGNTKTTGNRNNAGSIAPTGNEPTERTFRGKKYIYCDHGETKWVLEEKRGVKHIHSCTKLNGSTSDTASSSGSETKATPKKQSAWNKALAAVQEDVSAVTEADVEDENIGPE
ncbi:MAG: hypothetical protein SGARI_006107 [Bacillariaceae sp.]